MIDYVNTSKNIFLIVFLSEQCTLQVIGIALAFFFNVNDNGAKNSVIIIFYDNDDKNSVIIIFNDKGDINSVIIVINDNGDKIVLALF